MGLTLTTTTCGQKIELLYSKSIFIILFYFFYILSDRCKYVQLIVCLCG